MPRRALCLLVAAVLFGCGTAEEGSSTTTSTTSTTVAAVDADLVCDAVGARLAWERDDPAWRELLAALGNDPATYPQFGGWVTDAPDVDEPLVVYVTSPSQESIQRYTVDPDGTVHGPELQYGGPTEGPQEGVRPDLEAGLEVLAGQTGMGVESGGTVHCSFRFDEPRAN